MKQHDFEMISVEEFAARMGVSRSTVFAWLAKGHLPEGKVYVRIGKTIRFIWSIEAIAAMSEKNASESFPETSDPLKSGRKSAMNLEF